MISWIFFSYIFIYSINKVENSKSDFMLKIFSNVAFCLLLFLLIWQTAALSAWASQEAEDKELVASAQDLELTRDEVREIRSFLEENTPFRTSQEEYIKYALQMKLFAREALQQGLAGEEWSEHEPRNPKELYIFSDVYLEHILEQQKLDEAVIESYYHAFPERFLKDEDDPEVQERLDERGYIPDEWLKPLEEVRSEIRNRVLRSRLQEIREQAFQDLKKKYEARIHE